MKLFRFAALAFAAAVSWTAPAHSQIDTVAVWKALAPACPGAEVRLALVTADSVRGQCGRVDYGRLMLREGAGERQIALAQIDSVWVRARGTASVARAGGIIGALTVGGTFMIAVNGLCESPSGCGSDPYVAGGLGALLGYLSGSLFGSLIGRTMTVWDRRYP